MYKLYSDLRARIYQQGYTTSSVAAHIGLTPQQMSARMRGRVPFTLPEIAAIGSFLNIDARDYYTVFVLAQLQGGALYE